MITVSGCLQAHARLPLSDINNSRLLSVGCGKAFWEMQGTTDYRGNRQESGHIKLMTRALHITDRWYNRVWETDCSIEFTSQISVFKGSTEDDLKLIYLVASWLTKVCLFPTLVEKVDQLHHPSWSLYEPVMMNLTETLSAAEHWLHT